jgi:hypothetical protein
MISVSSSRRRQTIVDPEIFGAMMMFTRITGHSRPSSYVNMIGIFYLAIRGLIGLNIIAVALTIGKLSHGRGG